MRRHPDLNLPRFGATVARQRLDHVSWNRAHAALTGRGIEWAGAAAARWKLDIAPDGFFAHRRHGVIDRRLHFANSKRGHGPPGDAA